MKELLNWRRWVLNLLTAGCFCAFCMMCDETDNTLEEFVLIRICAAILMLVCGWSLARLSEKWRRERKIP